MKCGCRDAYFVIEFKSAIVAVALSWRGKSLYVNLTFPSAGYSIYR